MDSPVKVWRISYRYQDRETRESVLASAPSHKEAVRKWEALHAKMERGAKDESMMAYLARNHTGMVVMDCKGVKDDVTETRVVL